MGTYGDFYTPADRAAAEKRALLTARVTATTRRNAKRHYRLRIANQVIKPVVQSLPRPLRRATKPTLNNQGAYHFLTRGGIGTLFHCTPPLETYPFRDRYDLRLLVRFPESPEPPPRFLTYWQRLESVPDFSGVLRAGRPRRSDEVERDIQTGQAIGWYSWPGHFSLHPANRLADHTIQYINTWKHLHTLHGERTVVEPRFTTLNGQQTRKRRADTTEIDLIASNNGFRARAGDSFHIEREGMGSAEQVDTPLELPSVGNKRLRLMLHWFLPTTLVLMMSQLYSAFSSIGDTLSRYVGIYRVAERFTKTETEHTNKRVKIGPVEREAAKWIDPWTHGELQDRCFPFYKFINIISNGLRAFEDNPSINKILSPLTPHTTVEERRTYNKLYGAKPHLAFWLQNTLASMWRVFDAVYDPQLISNLKVIHPSVENTFDYGLDPSELETIRKLQRLLLDPAFVKVMNKLLDAFRTHDPALKTLRFPRNFLRPGIIDLEAVLQGVPAPSYITSTDYTKNFLAIFGDGIGKDPSEGRRHPNRNFTLPEEPELPGAYPMTPPRTPSPERAQTQLVTYSVPEEPQIQSPPSPPTSSNSPRNEETPTRVTRRRHQPYLRDDGLVYPSVEAFNQHHRDPRRYINDSAIKSRYVRNFTPRTPLRGTPTRNQRAGVLRGQHSSAHSPPQRPPRKVHFDPNVASPAPRNRDGLNIPRLAPDSPFHRSRQHRRVSAPEDEQDNTSSNNSDGEQEEARYLWWDNNTSTEEQEGRQPFSLRQWFKEEENRSHKQGLQTPALEQLRISDDSREHIRLLKERVEKIRKEREELRRLAEIEKQLEEQRRLKAEVVAKTGGLRIPEHKFVTAISEEWKTKVDATLHASAETVLAKSRDGVEIRRNEFDRLVPSTTWLNDEVVNGTLQWLDQAINLAAGVKDPKKQTRKCLAMSSLWVKTFMDKNGKGTERTLRRFGVTKDNLLDVETILVPICNSMHWTLLVVRPKRRTIAHMDSLSATGSGRITGLAAAWMRDVLGDKYVDEEWSVVRHEAPMQNNGYDCGVHTITNGMCVALGLSPVHSYSRDEMPMQRLRIASVLLNGGFVGEFDLQKF